MVLGPVISQKIRRVISSVEFLVVLGGLDKAYRMVHPYKALVRGVAFFKEQVKFIYPLLSSCQQLEKLWQR